ncbi:MAG: hypothetical protein OIF50_08205 [Flavobacteriaceae bacterium]|nr:hypothetical protein [Flavobacteriaceae bacterium]
MAIIKQAKNIRIHVRGKYQAYTKGVFTHLADSIHIESYNEDLKVFSAKANYIRGNHKSQDNE